MAALRLVVSDVALGPAAADSAAVGSGSPDSAAAPHPSPLGRDSADAAAVAGT